MSSYFPDNLEASSDTPEILKPWLVYTQSLTDKLRHEAGDAQLAVLNQNLIHATWWDRFVLKVDAQAVTQREILMSAHGHPSWYARTIIPENTLATNEHFFGRLKQESLGDIIFGNDNIKRITMINYAIDANCIEYYWLDSTMRGQSQIFWARLAMFDINGAAPFFLIEILLPGLLTALGHQSN